MNKTICTLALITVGSICWLSTAATNKPPNKIVNAAKSDIDFISAGWFRAGAEMGYVVALKGGTRADLQLIIEAQRTNSVSVVSNWFATH